MNQPVLVTTKYRGVFFGYVSDDTNLPAEITITGARNCIYWENCGGFLGLASNGPNKDCRIGARLDDPLTLYKITSCARVSTKATEAWETAKTHGVE